MGHAIRGNAFCLYSSSVLVYGDSAPAVVIPILIQHYVLLQRNLLYTGVTRGKKLVVLVGTRKGA